MNCPNCGAPIKKVDMFCGNCGERNIKRQKKLRKKKHSFVFLLFILIIVLGAMAYAQIEFELLSSIIRWKEINAEAEKIVSYISKDMDEEALNLIFAENGILEYMPESEGTLAQTDSKGIVGILLEEVELELDGINIFNRTATYTIIAMDMSSFVQDYASNGGESDIRQFFSDYIRSDRMKAKAQVTVNYYIGEGVTFDYYTPEFTDAIVGGLFSSYKQFYYTAVKSALEEVENYNAA